MLAGLTQADINEFFKHMDVSGDGRISINELLSMIQGTKQSHDDRMASFSPEFESELKREIEALFDRMALTRRGQLRAEDML